MSPRCPRPLAALTAIVYLCIPAFSQPVEMPVLKGEIQTDSPVNFHDYRIELEDLAHRGDGYRAEPNFNGEFEFRRVNCGDYTLRIVTQRGEIVQQEFVTVNPHQSRLSVRFSQTGREPSAPGTISLTQLAHPPDRKAFQRFAAAQRFSESGNPEKAAAELEKALLISPEYADAYANLAVAHIRMQRFEDALAELTRAIQIAGPNPLMLCNLAYAQAKLQLITDATASLRAALRLNAGYPQAHLLLGSILAADPRTRTEAISHLQLAAETLPSARVTLEKLR